MLLTPVVLFLGLMIATAFIAHWSDNLGKKLGKKRVSLFGLRPRTTATVLTVVSSWGIMILTLLVLLLTYAPLRNALLRYDLERNQNRVLRRDTAKLVAQREQLARRAEETQRLLSQKTRQTLEVEQRLVGTRKQLQNSATSLAAANRSLGLAKTNERQARQAEERAVRGEVRAEKLAREAVQRQAAAQRALSGVQSRLSSASYGLSLTQERLRVVQGRIASLGIQLQRARGLWLNATRANLELSAKEIALRSDVEGLTTQKSALDEQVRVLRQTSEFYLRQRDEYLLKAQIYGNKPPRLLADQVLAERTLPARTSQTEALRHLREVFAEGQAVMPMYVADSPETGDAGAQRARLSLFRLVWPPGPDAVPLTEEATLKYLTQMIASHGESVSLRLISARNYFEGEQDIEARFIVVPVLPGYRDGELVVQETFMAGQQDAIVFKFLLDLIEKGRLAATEKQVNPPLSPVRPDFYNVDTKVKLFQTLRKLESLKGPVTVKLLADGNQTTVEPLKVRFAVD